MGFRSTFTSQQYDITWPAWFRAKYAGTVWFHENSQGSISAKVEQKLYAAFAEFPEDIQKAIDWDRFGPVKFVVVFLHECGGITRCQIEHDAIKWSEPLVWDATQGVGHNYCYGCSDVKG